MYNNSFIVKSLDAPCLPRFVCSQDEEKTILPMATTLAKGFQPVHGTGARHRVKPWPVSPHTEKSNRLVLPPEFPVKQVFVLDFPPRLASELAQEQFLREEFCRVAAKNVRSFTTTVVVKGGWRSQPETWDAPEDRDQSSVRILPHEVCVPPVVLRECSVVLNPIRFSTDKLAAMDRIVPSNLDIPMYATMGNHTKKRKVAHVTTAVVSKGKKARLEALQTPAKVAKPSKLVPPRPVPEAAVPATLEGSVFVHSSKKLKVNQPTARVDSSQRQQKEPTPWGPKVVMAQADKPTAKETSF
ncbi:unnamed protein product [Boreogadus saida]